MKRDIVLTKVKMSERDKLLLDDIIKQYPDIIWEELRNDYQLVSQLMPYEDAKNIYNRIDNFFHDVIEICESRRKDLGKSQNRYRIIVHNLNNWQKLKLQWQQDNFPKHRCIIDFLNKAHNPVTRNRCNLSSQEEIREAYQHITNKYSHIAWECRVRVSLDQKGRRILILCSDYITTVEDVENKLEKIDFPDEKAFTVEADTVKDKYQFVVDVTMWQSFNNKPQWKSDGMNIYYETNNEIYYHENPQESKQLMNLTQTKKFGFTDEIIKSFKMSIRIKDNKLGSYYIIRNNTLIEELFQLAQQYQQLSEDFKKLMLPESHRGYFKREEVLIKNGTIETTFQVSTIMLSIRTTSLFFKTNQQDINIQACSESLTKKMKTGN